MAPRRTTCRYFSRPYYHPLAIPLIPSYSSPYYYPHRSVLYAPTELRAYRATRLRSRQNKRGAPERRPAVKRLVIILILIIPYARPPRPAPRLSKLLTSFRNLKETFRETTQNRR